MSNYTQIDKFHTISLKTVYIKRMNPDEISLHVLLMYYMRIASMKYKSEEEILRLEENLYDFSFKIRACQFGCYYGISFQGNAIHPKYVNDKEYTIDKIYEAYEDLSTPLIHKECFDEKILKEAKNQFIFAYQQGNEDPDSLATLGAIKEYFRGTLRDYDPRGSVKVIKGITAKELYSYYEGLMRCDCMRVGVGDFQGIPLLKDTTRSSVYSDIRFSERRTIRRYNVHKKADTQQSYLRIIYDTYIFSGDERIYSLSLLNYVLGGSSYSHLFRIVRETYGLCYSISSTLFGASGIIMVSAEIQLEKLSFVLEKIDEAIDTVLSNLHLEEVKEHMILTMKEGYDSPDAYLDDILHKKYFTSLYDSDIYEERIRAVTMEDLRESVKLLKKKKFVYTYGGDFDE